MNSKSKPVEPGQPMKFYRPSSAFNRRQPQYVEFYKSTSHPLVVSRQEERGYKILPEKETIKVNYTSVAAVVPSGSPRSIPPVPRQPRNFYTDVPESDGPMS